MPANVVFRRKIWGARDNGIPPRSTPVNPKYISSFFYYHSSVLLLKCTVHGWAWTQLEEQSPDQYGDI